MKPQKIGLQKSLNQIKNMETSKITLPQYENIVLTEDEINEALRLARRFKESEIKNREYWDKIKNPPPLPLPPPTQIRDPLKIYVLISNI